MLPTKTSKDLHTNASPAASSPSDNRPLVAASDWGVHLYSCYVKTKQKQEASKTPVHLMTPQNKQQKLKVPKKINLLEFKRTLPFSKICYPL